MNYTHLRRTLALVPPRALQRRDLVQPRRPAYPGRDCIGAHGGTDRYGFDDTTARRRGTDDGGRGPVAGSALSR